MERVQAAAAGSLSETEQTLGEQVLCSRQMEEAIDLWRRVYENDAPWLEGGRVKGMNLLPAICSEVARLVTLEFDWTVEGAPAGRRFCEPADSAGQAAAAAVSGICRGKGRNGMETLSRRRENSGGNGTG